jgi:hypothetical protein
VLVGGEHRLIGVAACTRAHLGLPEAMRRVALRAAHVAAGDRALVDVKR